MRNQIILEKDVIKIREMLINNLNIFIESCDIHDEKFKEKMNKIDMISNVSMRMISAMQKLSNIEYKIEVDPEQKIDSLADIQIMARKVVNHGMIVMKPLHSTEKQELIYMAAKTINDYKSVDVQELFDSIRAENLMCDAMEYMQNEKHQLYGQNYNLEKDLEGSYPLHSWPQEKALELQEIYERQYNNSFFGKKDLQESKEIQQWEKMNIKNNQTSDLETEINHTDIEIKSTNCSLKSDAELKPLHSWPQEKALELQEIYERQYKNQIYENQIEKPICEQKQQNENCPDTG